MAKRQTSHRAEGEELSLFEAAEMILEECRTVLPGIQALFGFQLIAVFNSGFAQKLTPDQQHLHLFAIALVVAGAGLIMTPAAYHRQNGSRRLTWRFVDLSTRLLILSMPLLAVGICLDLYLIARIVLGDGWGAPALAGCMLVVLLLLWFLVPRALGSRPRHG
jgi:hypothetical protein